MPSLADDEVVDFLVTEAIIVKVNEARKAAEKEAKREQWRKGHRELVESATKGASMI